MLKTITVTISKTKTKSKHVCQQRLGNCYNLSPNLQCGCSPQRQTWNWIWRDIETSKRPDTAPLSVSSMQVLLLELTVPWEEHMDEANEKSNPHIRSWWGSAGGETGRHAASLLKWGPEDSQVGHCARSTCYSTSQGLRKSERKSLLLALD